MQEAPANAFFKPTSNIAGTLTNDQLVTTVAKQEQVREG